MKKFLIFRTDRVGDFILTCILIKSIKRNRPDSEITVICSDQNYDYVKNYSLVDNAKLYPKKFINKVFFFLTMIKSDYDCVLSLDGKKRSIFGCVISKAKLKIMTVTKKIYKNIFFNLKDNILFIKDFKSRIEEFKFILRKVEIDYSDKDLDIFDSEKIKSNLDIINGISDKSFNQLHLDEKWITESYRGKRKSRNFKPINASIEQMCNFIREFVKKSQKDLVISAGAETNSLIIGVKENFHKNDISFLNGRKIIILDNISFTDLKLIIKKANIVIACHGSPAHVASSFNTKIIDIFDQKNEEFYKFYTNHLRNYKYLYREDFSILAKNILQLV
ncbi:hypothetical protein N9U33_02260 [Candidatus Pelagibacter bacterium]|nr:hypothetical protein [Candidatus Pelagibacter bacterium]